MHDKLAYARAVKRALLIFCAPLSDLIDSSIFGGVAAPSRLRSGRCNQDGTRTASGIVANLICQLNLPSRTGAHPCRCPPLLLAKHHGTPSAAIARSRASLWTKDVIIGFCAGFRTPARRALHALMRPASENLHRAQEETFGAPDE